MLDTVFEVEASANLGFLAITTKKTDLLVRHSINEAQNVVRGRDFLLKCVDNKNLLGELAEKAGDKVPKDKKEDEEEEEKEEEEKYTVEYVNFNYYQVENSGRTLKQKPNVLMCCKLEAFGYTIEQKIYAEAVGLCF